MFRIWTSEVPFWEGWSRRRFLNQKKAALTLSIDGSFL
jgi:hypothetical protein